MCIVYAPALVSWVDELICTLPFPVSGILFSPSSVYPADYTRNRDPEKKGNKYDSSNNIVFEKFQEAANTDVINEVPDSDNILICLFTLAFIAKALKAWCSIRKNINRSHSIARAVEVSSTASFTGISTAITHTGLLPLGFTEGNTLALPAFPFLYAVCSICHVIRLGTGSAEPVHSASFSQVA